MIYTLCHKNIPVFDFETNNHTVIQIKNVMASEHIPLGIFTQNSTEDNKIQNFEKWWKTRAIPASRQNLKEALEALGNITVEKLITESFGLSLSDHYWAKPKDSNLKWENINFFMNDFSEDVGKALFGNLNILDPKEISLISPDNTSDGWLKKKWIIKDNQRYLLKSGSGLEQQEPFNEVLASEICNRLDIFHVDYSIVKQEWTFYSICKDFVDLNTEFVPANRIYNMTEYNGGLWDKYEHFKNNCKLAGILFSEEIEKALCSIFVLDFIMANTDRHLGNFGFLRNPDTLEWLGIAPVFDTGSSMFYQITTQQLKDKDSIASNNITARPFGYKHSDQLKLLPYKKYINNFDLSALKDINLFFNDLLSQNENILEERRTLLCKILKERIDELKIF